MDNQKQLSWINHHYGNIQLVAVAEVGKGSSGEIHRLRLRDRISALGEGRILEEFLDIVDTWNWEDKTGLDKARGEYKEFKVRYKTE